MFFTSLAAVCTAFQLCATTKNKLEDNIDLRDRGIHQSFENGKIYLFSDKLHATNACWFFFNDQSQFVPIESLLQDGNGYYINADEPVCLRGHTGIVRRGGRWFCNFPNCPYSIGENF